MELSAVEKQTREDRTMMAIQFHEGKITEEQQCDADDWIDGATNVIPIFVLEAERDS